MFNGIRTSISHVVTTVSQRLHVPKIVSIGILGLVAAGVPAGGYFLMSHSVDIECCTCYKCQDSIWLVCVDYRDGLQ